MPASAARPAPNPALIRAIHACRRQVPALADDEAWRGFLVKATGKISTREMDGRELGRVIDALHENGAPRRAGQGAGRPRHLLDSRPQARMARGLWIEMAKAGAVRDGAESALDSFCERITGRTSLRFCDARQLNQVVEALKEMLRRGPPSGERGERREARAQVPPAWPRNGQEPPHVGPIADEITRLWDRLRHSGRLRHGPDARLDTWLLRAGYRQANPEYLTPEQAEHARARLASWLQRIERETSA